MKKFPKIDCEDCTSRQDSIFSDLCGPEMTSLSERKTCNVYKKGQIIFYEGNRPTGLFCINRGKIKVYKMGKIGKEQIVRLANAGNILGYRALICEEVYSASAEALEDALVCFIDKKNFFDVLQNSADMPLRVMQMLSQELGEAENFIQSLAQKSVRERVAEVLLILKKKYGMDKQDKDLLGISLTREDLANLVGTATETIIRLLSHLKNEKIISFEGKRIKFLNADKLIKVANLEY